MLFNTLSLMFALTLLVGIYYIHNIQFLVKGEWIMCMEEILTFGVPRLELNKS